MKNEKRLGCGGKLFISVSFVYALSIIAWVILQSIYGDAWRWLYFANIVAVFLFIPVIAQFIIAILTNNNTAWASFGIVFMIGIYYFGGLFLPSLGQNTSAQSVTVMTTNILAIREQTAPVIQAIRLADPDIVAIQELNAELADDIESTLTTDYPYQLLNLEAGFGGMGIISKYPFTQQQVNFSAPWYVGYPQVVQVDVNGKEFRLINFHGEPPDASEQGFKETNELRNWQAQDLVSLVAYDNLPVIALGDLNSTPHNDAYKIMRSELEDAWVERGFGLGHTRQNLIADIPPKWLVRIDYVFHSPDLQTISAEIGPWDGSSDHRPVVAEIGLK